MAEISFVTTTPRVEAKAQGRRLPCPDGKPPPVAAVIGIPGKEGPPGPAGPAGESTVADPGDLTLIFDNKLI